MATDNDNINLPSNDRQLNRGDRGPEVKKVQEALGVQPTGLFGPTTEEFVKKFQQAQNLTADGIVGPITAQRLEPLYDQARAASQSLPEVQPPLPSSATIKKAELARRDAQWKQQVDGLFNLGEWGETVKDLGNSAQGFLSDINPANPNPPQHNNGRRR
jgi:peptidoglycan hydrolase-like protein with peptidoglycan-binding domain